MDEHEVVQLFYYFIESEGNPTEDPLILWMTGGAGCSGLCGLWFEIGVSFTSFFLVCIKSTLEHVD